jgi:hypothetical protein
VKVILSVGEETLSDRVIDDLRDAGASFRVQEVDRKIVFLASIEADRDEWPQGWVFSVLINNKKQTVLLRAETKESIPSDKMRQIDEILSRVNRKGLDGQFMLNDVDSDIVYFVGPLPYCVFRVIVTGDFAKA